MPIFKNGGGGLLGTCDISSWQSKKSPKSSLGGCTMPHLPAPTAEGFWCAPFGAPMALTREGKITRRPVPVLEKIFSDSGGPAPEV